MTESPDRREPTESVPEAVIETRARRLSVVWLIPIVAALVGAFVAWRALAERGPSITIEFRSAEGLEAGATKVKYKNVELGVVEEIVLADDFSSVRCRARMVHGAEAFLRDGTRFWVERARVSGGQVSGLSTILSGAYIGVDPVREGPARRSFEGLDAPPVVTMDQPGRHFVLRSYRAGAIDVGVPVYYRKIRVGSVVSSELDPAGEFVRIGIFVEEPHDQRVRTDSRFWNASGFDVDVSAGGVRLDTESVVSVLIGGIAFDSPPTGRGASAPADTTFVLHPDRRTAETDVYGERRYYVASFSQSVRGLAVGAPVEFQGIPVGRVTAFELEFDPERQRFDVPVVLEIEPGRIAGSQAYADEATQRANLDRLVALGLRAQLKSGNLLTGQLYVALDIHKEAPVASVDWSQPLPRIPTVPTPIEEITSSVARLAQKIEKLPFDALVADLRASLGSLRTTLAEADRTLASAGGVVSRDGPLVQDLGRTLEELTEAARALGLAADQLERHPESLLFGKGGGE